MIAAAAARRIPKPATNTLKHIAVICLRHIRCRSEATGRATAAAKPTVLAQCDAVRVCNEPNDYCRLVLTSARRRLLVYCFVTDWRSGSTVRPSQAHQRTTSTLIWTATSKRRPEALSAPPASRVPEHSVAAQLSPGWYGILLAVKPAEEEFGYTQAPIPVSSCSGPQGAF